MKSTGLIRPMKTVCADLQDLASPRCWPDLEELYLQPFSEEVGVQLSTCPSNQFPRLRIAELSGSVSKNSLCGLRSFVEFASKRQIVELGVKMLIMNVTDGVPSSATLRNIGLCTSLQSLMIDIIDVIAIRRPPVVDRADTVDAHNIGIPAGSLPHLVVLRLAWNDLTVSAVDAFLAAAPNCRQADIGSLASTMNPCVIIAMILHHCSEICRISIISGCRSVNQGVDTALDPHPNHISGLSKLLLVQCLSSVELQQATLHRLISRLCMARRLALVEITHATDFATMSILHRLSSLITHSHCNKADSRIGTRKRIKAKPQFDIPSLNGCLKKLRTQEFVSSLEREMARPLTQPSTLKALTMIDIVAELFGEERTCNGFDPAVDEAGNTGRERFFNVLHSTLSEADKAKFAAWDHGDYTYDLVTENGEKIQKKQSKAKPSLLYYIR